MSLPESYLALRRGLLVRLAASVLLSVTAVVVGLSFAPEAGDESLRASTAPPTATAAAVSGASAPIAISSIQRAEGAGDTLADAMRSVSELESLDGKSLEVLMQRTTDDSSGNPAGEGEHKAASQPAKLPKGPHLQAGIFASTANAEEMKKKLEAAGYPAYLETRVHVGPFQNRKEADKVREKLKDQGTSTLFIPQ